LLQEHAQITLSALRKLQWRIMQIIVGKRDSHRDGGKTDVHNKTQIWR